MSNLMNGNSWCCPCLTFKMQKVRLSVLRRNLFLVYYYHLSYGFIWFLYDNLCWRFEQFPFTSIGSLKAVWPCFLKGQHENQSVRPVEIRKSAELMASCCFVRWTLHHFPVTIQICAEECNHLSHCCRRPLAAQKGSRESIAVEGT